MPHNIAVLVGSLRKDSYNRKIANAIAGLAPAGVTFEQVPIGDLPLYNEDLETSSPPAQWTAFREKIRSSDAVLFATPEYNRSVPAALKNAIDVGSRPYGKSVFQGKPAAVVSASVGPIGGFGANHHLRQSLVFLDMPVLQQPEAYVGSAQNLFDDAGKLKNADTEKFLRGFAEKFAEWISRNR
ncbi:MAG TPA: NAD(P)H-dependent oxidoreductase [Povalibacter sp.]